jgi:HEAT repeat protein
LARAIALCESAIGKQRRVGAAILGQLGHSNSSGSVFRSERFDALEQLVEGEARRGQDPEVLGDALVALGHLNDDRAIPIAVSLIGHSSAKVRRGVVMALSRHDDEAAIGGLIQLSCDSDDDIRDWATFGLGMLIDTDTDSIRAALFARLTDDHPDTRAEAIAGLARRGSKSRP